MCRSPLPVFTFALVSALAFAPSVRATEYVKLSEHPELRRLYNAANALYRAASGCREGEDCICLHQDRVGPALEHLLKMHVEHEDMVNTFILDEQGLLRTPQGRGALVRLSEIKAIRRTLEQCTGKPVEQALEKGEAPTTLRALYAAETAYYAAYNAYLPMKKVGFLSGCDLPRELGIELEGCADGQARYAYTVRLTAKGQGFIAEARSGLGGNNLVYPGCATPDVWSIDQDQRLLNVNAAAKKCAEKPKESPAGGEGSNPKANSPRSASSGKKGRGTSPAASP